MSGPTGNQGPSHEVGRDVNYLPTRLIQRH